MSKRSTTVAEMPMREVGPMRISGDVLNEAVRCVQALESRQDELDAVGATTLCGELSLLAAQTVPGN
jgi:hypothetical protein